MILFVIALPLVSAVALNFPKIPSFVTFGLENYQDIYKSLNWTSPHSTYNPMKERYANWHAADHTRVQLSNQEYINANHISVGSYKSILGQYPIKNSFGDVWLMIWEQQVGSIVILTKDYEVVNGHEFNKGDPYWPRLQDSDMLINNILVKLTNLSNMQDFIVYTLSLSRSGETRQLLIFEFIAWPDLRTTEPEKLFHLLKTVKSMHPTGKNQFIHCSAGIGRASTFAILDSVVTNDFSPVFNPNNDPVVISFNEMRSQRKIIPSVDQFRLIYETLGLFYSKRF